MRKSGGPEGLGVEWAPTGSEAACSRAVVSCFETNFRTPTPGPTQYSAPTRTALSFCQSELLAVLKQKSLAPASKHLMEKLSLPVSFSLLV